MTISPLRESFVVHCDSDGCPEYLEVETLDFDELVKTMRLKNWKTYRDNHEIWTHKCSACQEGGK